MASVKIYLWIGLAVVALIGAGGVYWSIYKSGADAEIRKQEKALNELKDKTDAAQDHALTTPTPNDELRKYARPD